MKAHPLAMAAAALALSITGVHAHEGEEGDTTLPPLVLNAQHKALLAARNKSPKTAADYYFALPDRYFSIVEHGPKRRATFVEFETLSDHYLHAGHFFECDAGGFDVTIRVFDTKDGPLIGIRSSTDDIESLFDDQKAAPGKLQSISVGLPKFWRYKEGKWIAAKDVTLPLIDKEFVIDRYHNVYKADLQYPDQQKFISLEYELPRKENVIRVTGRENFMEPTETFVWAEYEFDGAKFVRKESK